LTLDAAPGTDWVESYARWHDLPPASIRWHRAIVERIGPPHVAARVRDGAGRLVAIGLAVADGPWVGLFDLVTAPELRSRGIGRALLGGLLGWGAGEGASAAYLQVEEPNERARGMYGHSGFATAYRYWYRVASSFPSPHAG
ncbi:GNAT family N-acetyltransferase, partial [bacterium]|nr:GNAT family N-acetyltransferase [bacterium]